MSNKTKHIETVYKLSITRRVVDPNYDPNRELRGLHNSESRYIAETALDVELTPEQFALVKKAVIEQWV